jgi:hypothetical protein
LGDADVISELSSLAQSCQDAARSGADLAERYAVLRAQGIELNERGGWATADELEALIPTVDGLVAIELLDRAFGEMSGPDLPIDRGSAARLTEALLQLAGWATGVRLAQEALPEMDSQ